MIFFPSYNSVFPLCKPCSCEWIVQRSTHFFSEENPWDHLLLFSFISHHNQLAVSISCASQMYTKSDHFLSPSLLSLNPSHQHLLCLWFSCAPYNIHVVMFLKCKCKHVLPLFKVFQCPSITMRIISNLPKWSTSMSWLGTSLPLGPQFLSISAWFTKPKPLWFFFSVTETCQKISSFRAFELVMLALWNTLCPLQSLYTCLLFII